jgi:hypothetical protein
MPNRTNCEESTKFGTDVDFGVLIDLGRVPRKTILDLKWPPQDGFSPYLRQISARF